MSTVSTSLLLLLGFSLGGCASLTNYTAPIDLRTKSVSIDVKQRVVFSLVRAADRARGAQVVVCAEPSPDALTVLGASGPRPR